MPRVAARLRSSARRSRSESREPEPPDVPIRAAPPAPAAAADDPGSVPPGAAPLAGRPLEASLPGAGRGPLGAGVLGETVEGDPDGLAVVAPEEVAPPDTWAQTGGLTAPSIKDARMAASDGRMGALPGCAELTFQRRHGCKRLSAECIAPRAQQAGVPGPPLCMAARPGGGRNGRSTAAAPQIRRFPLQNQGRSPHISPVVVRRDPIG